MFLAVLKPKTQQDSTDSGLIYAAFNAKPKRVLNLFMPPSLLIIYLQISPAECAKVHMHTLIEANVELLKSHFCLLFLSSSILGFSFSETCLALQFTVFFFFVLQRELKSTRIIFV